MFVLAALIVLFAILNQKQSAREKNKRDVLNLPVRVYSYRFDNKPSLDASFDEDQVRADFEKVNSLWSQAGIKWEVESFQEKVIPESKAANFENSNKQSAKRVMFNIAPPKNDDVWSVVYFKKMPIPAGGFYAAPVYTIYYPELNPRGEHHPELLVHELGHSLLGSEHSNIKGNIMYSEGEASSLQTLTEEQIKRAREQAVSGPLGSEEYTAY